MANIAKFKHAILAVAIAIVLVLFIGLGIATFYPGPQYEDFCGEREFKTVDTKGECETLNGKWTETGLSRPIPRELAKPFPDRDLSDRYICNKLSETDQTTTFECQTIKEITERGFCDVDFFCRKELEDVREIYNRNVFIFATGLGLVAIITGFALGMASVSGGLMGGGILSIIYGTIRFWSDLPDYGRFIIFGIALATLIWLGYKRIKK